MLPASFEREGAAKKIGRRTAAPGAQPKRGVDRILREEILEPQRWAARIIAQPVRVAARENHQIAGMEPSWLAVRVDL